MSNLPIHSKEVASIRAGEPDAFDRLYARYAAHIMGFGLRLTGGNRAEAEDLTQETFLAAYAGRDGFARRSSALSYLLGITWRRWRDGTRKTTVATEALNEEMVPATDPIAGIATTITLEAALLRLAPVVREAVLLTAVQGLTYAEAARVLQVPVGTVKWRVHEGTREMRRTLTAAEERYEAGQPQQVGKPRPSGSAHPARSR